MISEKAKNFLYYLVDKCNSKGRNSLDNDDYVTIIDHEKLLIELHNAGLLLYYDDSLTGRVELTPEGMAY